MTMRSSIGVLAGLLIGCVPVLGQPDRPVLVLEYAGMDAMVADPRDRPMAEAFKLLPLRVRELQREIPDFPPELATLANLVLTHIARPARMAIVYNEGNPGGMFGYGVLLSIQSSGQEDAEALHATLTGLMREGEAPFPINACARWGTMSEVQLPFGLVAFGPRETKTGWRYELIVGSVAQPDEVFDGLPRGERGMRVLAAASFDGHALEPLVETIGAMAGDNPKAAGAIGAVRESGALGEEGLRANMVMGVTETHSLTRTVVQNLEKLGDVFALSKEPLTAEDLRSIPRDATLASIGRGSIEWLVRGLDEAEANDPQVGEMLGQFREMTGVDLRADVLATLGGTMGMYMSESTGGGGLMSAVGLVSFKDRARFMQSHGKLMAFANNMADQAPMGPGYIRLKGWKDGDNSLVSLRFPGLPVPLEPTYAFTDRWLIVGMTPQATMAAARQAAGKGDAGLTAHPDFAATMPRRPLVGVSFMDSRSFMGDGYALTTMLASGIANAVRSPTDPGREPGVLVPVFHELAKNVRPQTEYTFWDGEDLVVESYGDRCMLVNVAGGLGLVGKFAPLVAIPALGAAAQQGRLGWLDEPVFDWMMQRPSPRRVMLAGASLWLDGLPERVGAVEPFGR